jgi:ribosomal-protein-alanine acetyltransferase
VTTRSTASVVVRAMRSGDLRDVVRIESDSFSDPWPRTFFESELSVPGVRGYVATDRDRIVGFTMVRAFEDVAEIINVAVRKKHRHRGVAKSLLRHVLSVLKRGDVREVFLEVRESNEDAIRLYTSFGFEHVTTRRDYYRKPVENARVYRFRLS